MSNIIEKFDRYLAAAGPAAVVIREPLIPVEGADGVLFPSTFASGDNFPGGYNIDADVKDGDIALVDSVGSQANRIEPMFSEPEYAALVPQVVIKAGETKRISLLEAGHRAGDAIVRCSALQQELQDAFKALLGGNATALAKIAPTSLVFGVWDSRDTQAKMPRLIASTIRAYDVRKLTRSAQYVTATDYVGNQLPDPSDKATKDAYAERGFIHVPATGSHGGIIAKGGIRRDATLALAAMRLIHGGLDKAATLNLRRYILGLALVAFTRLPGGYLRQGTILVSDPDKVRVAEEFYSDGKRQPFNVTHEEALAYAKAAAAAFGVGGDREVAFDVERAKKDLEGKEKKPKGKKEKS